MNQVLVVLVASLISVASFAEGKIAVVSPQAAMMNTNFAKAKLEKFEKGSDFVASKAKLDGIVAEINALQASFKKDGQTWSQEKKEESEKKLQTLSDDYQIVLKRLQESQQKLQQQIMQELAEKAQAAIKQVSESEKIGLLLTKEAAIFATSEYDITPKVIDAMNKMLDQPAPAAAAPTPAKK